METKEYIESGILELYVFGILTNDENVEVAKMGQQFPEIKNEILSIEKAIMTLNFSMSPKVSADNYARIRNKIFDTSAGIIQLDTVKETSSSRWKSYLGWAAAVIFAGGIGYQYINNQKTLSINQIKIATAEKENFKLRNDYDLLNANKIEEIELAKLVKNDICNMAIALAGQAVAPQASAKIYWNKYSKEVYVDATNLPTPPDGMEYQIWSLKMSPLTPTSIGVLTSFKTNETKLFAVSSTDTAEGFGITLEPKGGSPTPTMEQLYTLGKV